MSYCLRARVSLLIRLQARSLLLMLSIGFTVRSLRNALLSFVIPLLTVTVL